MGVQMIVAFTWALMMAQAPASTPPATNQPVKIKKQKPRQICETVEVTGTRVPKRICRNADDPEPMNQDISDGLFGVAKVDKIVDPAISMPH